MPTLYYTSCNCASQNHNKDTRHCGKIIIIIQQSHCTYRIVGYFCGAKFSLISMIKKFADKNIREYSMQNHTHFSNSLARGLCRLCCSAVGLFPVVRGFQLHPIPDSSSSYLIQFLTRMSTLLQFTDIAYWMMGLGYSFPRNPFQSLYSQGLYIWRHSQVG